MSNTFDKKLCLELISAQKRLIFVVRDYLHNMPYFGCMKKQDLVDLLAATQMQWHIFIIQMLHVQM